MTLTLTSRNGRLPSGLLDVAGRGANGQQLLRIDAASTWHQMIEDGMPSGCLRSGYRSRIQQAAEWARMLAGLTPSAARPGRSFHGEGVAADVDEPARTWIRTRGRAYGWIKDTVRREPWHMVYDPALDTHAHHTTSSSSSSSSTPAAPRDELMEMITMATPEDLARAMLEPLYRPTGGTACFLDLGTVRRWIGGAQSAGRRIIDLTPLDPFWSVPVTSEQLEGECYARPGQAACWTFAEGTRGRFWLDAESHREHGSPPIRRLPADSPFWDLRVVGDVPPEGR